MVAEEDQREARTAARRPLSPALAARYGAARLQRVSTWLIAGAVLLACTVAIAAGEAGAASVVATLLWALLLTVADRRARRPQSFVLGALLALLVALFLPFGRHLLELFADLQWIPFAITYVLFALGGVIPLIVTPAVTYLWFARTGRIR